jgi:hypothetical protein
MPHLARGRVSAHEPCHVTLRLRPGTPSLRSVRFVRAFERSLAGWLRHGRIDPDEVPGP